MKPAIATLYIDPQTGEMFQAPNNECSVTVMNRYPFPITITVRRANKRREVFTQTAEPEKV